MTPHTLLDRWCRSTAPRRRRRHGLDAPLDGVERQVHLSPAPSSRCATYRCPDIVHTVCGHRHPTRPDTAWPIAAIPAIVHTPRMEGGRRMTTAHTSGHDAVLALLDWLPEDVDADAEVVADLLRIPEAEAARLLAVLEENGDINTSAGTAR